ncbi:hypothetical protein CQW23_06174 [Capsicum baccatum]|uniref:Leucine-rich repeat-containing N-terminal plant-type domain-containing protein n=1 Tax=Capsicum baccatum TaxID=33114 RepID=A0A2G2X2J8_CAPBA|nr:hypothetical protein CQW23_06174 [Capsicum baccatum]
MLREGMEEEGESEEGEEEEKPRDRIVGFAHKSLLLPTNQDASTLPSISSTYVQVIEHVILRSILDDLMEPLVKHPNLGRSIEKMIQRGELTVPAIHEKKVRDFYYNSTFFKDGLSLSAIVQGVEFYLDESVLVEGPGTINVRAENKDLKEQVKDLTTEVKGIIVMEPEVSTSQPTMDNNSTNVILAQLEAMSRVITRINAGIENLKSDMASVKSEMSTMGGRLEQVHDHALSKGNTGYITHQKALDDLKDPMTKHPSFEAKNEEMILWKSRKVNEVVSLRSNSSQDREDDTNMSPCWGESSAKVQNLKVSWNKSRDCCTWDGVTSDLLTSDVIGLDLSCSQLGGTIHPNSSLFQLHHLQKLNLAYNSFYPSPIPNGIGRLRNLRHLNLSASNFDSNIPTEISYLSNFVSVDLSVTLNIHVLRLDRRTFTIMLQNFTKLEVVSLYYVDISSPIPVNISSSLRYVDLRYTNLRGVLTESFFLLPNLENLKLSKNDILKGDLSKIQPSSSLLELDIAHTGIYGELPDSIGTFRSLNSLHLQGCQFSGPIPDSVGNLTQIRELDFGENNFTGHIPSTISKLKHLVLLDLRSNSLSNLQKLYYLDLSSNSFISLFPSPVLSLAHLEHLYLWGNSLFGPLPSNASMLQKPTNLGLSYNSLNGTVPSWMFSLSFLSSLSLHHNQLSGLADELKTNPTLEYLYLSNNQLTGTFPQSLVNFTNLVILDLSSNNINSDGEIQITFPRLEALQLSSCELLECVPCQF